MLGCERNEQLFADKQHNNAQLTDQRALLAATQHLSQEVAREGDALYRQWRPCIQRRSLS